MNRTKSLIQGIVIHVNDTNYTNFSSFIQTKLNKFLNIKFSLSKENWKYF